MKKWHTQQAVESQGLPPTPGGPDIFGRPCLSVGNRGEQLSYNLALFLCFVSNYLTCKEVDMVHVAILVMHVTMRQYLPHAKACS